MSAATSPAYVRKAVSNEAPKAHVHDSTLHVWFDDVFTEDVDNVFKRFKAHLNRRGFALSTPPSQACLR